jgi:hypothetical protein
MAGEEQQALIRRLAEEVFNQIDLAIAEEIYAPTILYNGEQLCIDELKDAISLLHRAIPGVRITTGLMIAAGNMLVTNWTVHHGAFPSEGNGAARAAHRPWTGLRLFCIQNGKITEVWANRDVRSRLEDLDLRLFPTPFDSCAYN